MQFERALKNYKLDDLLLSIGSRIRSYFIIRNPIGAEILEQREAGLVRRGRVTMAAWQLSDLAYQAILHTHDFASRIPTDRDIVNLMNLFHERDGRVGSEWLDSMSPEDKTLAFTVGFSQKQFWYQELDRIRAEFNRQVEMLEILSQRTTFGLQLNTVCKSATGFDLRQFRKLAFAMYAIGGRATEMTNFSFDGSAAKLDPIITAVNVHQVMEFYTADYQQLRSSPLAENAFFSRPIVRTATGRRIAVNEYFLARKIADGPYWILRDHFMALENRFEQEAFVRYFGELFDLYFEELLEFYFPSVSFQRVKGGSDSPKADWILQYLGWTIVVELKSSLLPLAARKNYPDPAVIRSYLPKLADGVIQLDATARALGDNPNLLKILVHYEPLFISDGVLRPLTVNLCSGRLVSVERIFFCDL
ncbi:MAG: hypothetical protein IMZ61_09740 [Planctomycetes bacterium]|nr:hypothetical protein [Planctomycetota bacterium]